MTDDIELPAIFEPLIAEVERTQRTEDVEGFLALFADDAHWVTGAGRRLVGKAQIADFTRSVLPGAFSSGSVTYVLEHVQRIEVGVVLTG